MRKLYTIAIKLMAINFLFASEPEIKNYEKQADLIDGEAEKISISADGKLFLAPQIKKIFSSSQPFVWDIASDSKGNLFIATGDGAKIFRLTTDGKVDSLACWSDSEVYALAVDKNGLLWAALSPGGKIYRFNRNNQPELLAELKVAYVWDLLFDVQNNCFAATGDSGKIYQLDAAGKVAVFFDSDETHIRCLAWDGEQNLLAGSYKNGYIFRLSQVGMGTIVFDSDFEEVNRIQIAPEGIIYAVAMSSSKTVAVPLEKQDKAREVQLDFAADDFMTIAAAPAKRKAQDNSAILKIQPNGAIKDLWDNSKEKVYSIWLTHNGLLVGTGEQGRLFSLTKDEEAAFIKKLPESQIFTIASEPTGECWLGASNLSAVYLMRKYFEKSGTYISPVIDATTKTKWGTIQWEEKAEPGDQIQFYTRTGNTKEPNSNWFLWQPVSPAKGQGDIKSVEARFLQWKLELSSPNQLKSPVVSKIKISYLQYNLPPEISTITIHPVQTKTSKRATAVSPVDYPSVSLSALPDPDDQLTKTMQQPVPYQPRLTDGYRRVSWRATDENKDQLIFSLYYRFKDDEDWWLLKDNLTRLNYTWDSQTMPDGIYQLRVVASDENSNPINTALKSAKESDWFTIDNTAPEIIKLMWQKGRNDSLQISFSVRDRLSAVKKVECSVDAQKWLMIYPLDLVCDSKEENFNCTLKLPNHKQPHRTIIVKATDESENIGYGRLKIGE